MTDPTLTTPPGFPEMPGDTRASRAAGSRAAKTRPRATFLSVTGEILITIGLVLALFIVWQLEWTTLEVTGPRDDRVKAFITQNQPAGKQIAPEHYEEPPIDQPVDGALGVLHVPEWKWMKIPVQEGTTTYVLDSGDAGHYEETALPGEIGNYSVAGHRRTYGNNFRQIDKLQPGVRVIMETSGHYYIYEYDSHSIWNAEDPNIGSVIAPVPGDLTYEQQPTERFMTMTTCNPEFGNWERYIVHLKLHHWTDKAEGIPAELQDEPDVGFFDTAW